MKVFKKSLIALLIISFCAFNLHASDETYDKLKLMVDVMEIINSAYVSETNPKDLAIGAIHGVVRTLDPFSQYMEEKAYKEMKDETEGSYSGIGLRIMVKNGFITVVSPIPSTPAYKAGILPEDIIIKIDDKSAINMSSDEAAELMRGKAGTKVKLTISRANVLEELEFVLTREKIKIETVKGIILEDNIGYIRLSEFNIPSASDLKKMISDFSKENIKGLILDLRNNPGGLLDSSIDITSMFIKDKILMLTTKGRDESVRQTYYTKGNGDFADLPLIVLVNRGSASASEIVSGALQDFQRALIMGTNTFGKGSVQSVIPLSDGSALRLTIAKYYLPSGRAIDHSDDKNAKNGITPDIEIKVSVEDEIKLYRNSEEIFNKDKNQKTVKKEENAQDPKEETVEDIVLNEAIKIIKEDRVKKEIEASKILVDKNTKEDEENKETKKQKKKK